MRYLILCLVLELMVKIDRIQVLEYSNKIDRIQVVEYSN